ncbi:MAG TPA: hypothetical protein VLE47_04500 [Candidatus Saccharimonadales bacterium]|nr:hypothetical protein [Candidatus Saccharimonadales bacterium]
MAKKPADHNQSIEELKKQLTQLQEQVAQQQQPTASQTQPAQTFEVRTLYAWKAPERIFIPRNRKWFTYLFLLLLIIILILLFLKQFIIIAPIAALGFVAYVMASVPPHDVEHKLTTEGVLTGGRSYLWAELFDYWFVKKDDHETIQLETYLNYPRRLSLLVGDGEKETIKQTMAQFIPFREIPKETFMDKAADYLSEKFHKIAS